MTSESQEKVQKIQVQSRPCLRLPCMIHYSFLQNAKKEELYFSFFLGCIVLERPFLFLCAFLFLEWKVHYYLAFLKFSFRLKKPLFFAVISAILYLFFNSGSIRFTGKINQGIPYRRVPKCARIFFVR